MQTLVANDFALYNGQRLLVKITIMLFDQFGVELVAAIVGKKIVVLKGIATDGGGAILRSGEIIGADIGRIPAASIGQPVRFDGFPIAETAVGENLFGLSIDAGTTTGTLWYVEAA